MNQSSSSSDHAARTVELERSIHDGAAGWWMSILVLVAVLLGVEGVTRTTPLERLLFRGGEHGAMVRPTVKAFLRARPPSADVMFLGSSRVHRGVDLRLIETELADRGFDDVSARNYAIGGSHIQELAYYVDAIGRVAPPRLLLIGVAPRALQGDAPTNWDDMRSLTEWGRVHTTEDSREPRDDVTLGGALHHELASRSMAVSFRERFREAAIDSLIDAWDGHWGRAAAAWMLPSKESPITGGLAWRHRDGEETLNLFDLRVQDRRVERAMQRDFPQGKFVYTPQSHEAFLSIGRSSRAHEVRVVVFELPWPELLRRHWPPGVQADFREAAAASCHAAGIEYVPFASLNVTIDDYFFREQSHLNLPGAQRLSMALIDNVIAPALRTEEDGAQSEHVLEMAPP
ncbi:MAG: hypothetical protein AAF823_00715 [Planctomycetota bacterium]